jgi:hypothetical protein
VHDDVGAELERALAQRRRERRVPTVTAPRSRAPAAITGMSATTMSGLAIDSTHTMSAPAAAARTAAPSSAGAMRTCRRPLACIRSKMFRTP